MRDDSDDEDEREVLAILDSAHVSDDGGDSATATQTAANKNARVKAKTSRGGRRKKPQQQQRPRSLEGEWAKISVTPSPFSGLDPMELSQDSQGDSMERYSLDRLVAERKKAEKEKERERESTRPAKARALDDQPQQKRARRGGREDDEELEDMGELEELLKELQRDKETRSDRSASSSPASASKTGSAADSLAMRGHPFFVKAARDNSAEWSLPPDGRAIGEWEAMLRNGWAEQSLRLGLRGKQPHEWAHWLFSVAAFHSDPETSAEAAALLLKRFPSLLPPKAGFVGALRQLGGNVPIGQGTTPDHDEAMPMATAPPLPPIHNAINIASVLSAAVSSSVPFLGGQWDEDFAGLFSVAIGLAIDPAFLVPSCSAAVSASSALRTALCAMVSAANGWLQPEDDRLPSLVVGDAPPLIGCMRILAIPAWNDACRSLRVRSAWSLIKRCVGRGIVTFTVAGLVAALHSELSENLASEDTALTVLRCAQVCLMDSGSLREKTGGSTLRDIANAVDGSSCGFITLNKRNCGSAIVKEAALTLSHVLTSVAQPPSPQKQAKQLTLFECM